MAIKSRATERGRWRRRGELGRHMGREDRIKTTKRVQKWGGERRIAMQRAACSMQHAAWLFLVM